MDNLNKSQETKDFNQENPQSFIEYVNVNEALSRVIGNKTLLKTLFNSFLTNNYVNQLKKDISDGNLSSAAESAHSLKGVSANLSLINLNKVAFELEMQLKNNQECSEIISELEVVMNETNKYLIELIEVL